MIIGHNEDIEVHRADRLTLDHEPRPRVRIHCFLDESIGRRVKDTHRAYLVHTNDAILDCSYKFNDLHLIGSCRELPLSANWNPQPSCD